MGVDPALLVDVEKQGVVLADIPLKYLGISATVESKYTRIPINVGQNSGDTL